MLNIINKIQMPLIWISCLNLFHVLIFFLNYGLINQIRNFENYIWDKDLK